MPEQGVKVHERNAFLIVAGPEHVVLTDLEHIEAQGHGKVAQPRTIQCCHPLMRVGWQCSTPQLARGGRNSG